ncbi:MAG: phenylacetic acid degradation b [Woeseiaceae bacterium]
MSLGRSTSQDQMFEVFGRDQVERPLAHIGSIVAPNQELAVARARILYSERPWVELCVAPANVFMGCLSAGQDGTIGMA